MLNWSAIRATALIFCAIAGLLGLVLIGLLHVEIVKGTAASVVAGGIVVSALIVLQQRLNRHSATLVRSEARPELGEVRVFGNTWHSSARDPERGRLFRLEGPGRESGPSALQMSLWEGIRSDLRNLTNVATRALSGVSDKPEDSLRFEEFRLASVWLDPPEGFALTLLYPSDSKWAPFAGYVRFKGQSVVEASWHRFQRSSRQPPEQATL